MRMQEMSVANPCWAMEIEILRKLTLVSDMS